MKKIQLNNINKLIKFNLLINKKTIIVQAVSFFLIMFMYMFLFPSIQEIGQAELESLPEEILSLFGMNSLLDLTKYNSYFGSQFSLIILAITIVTSFFTGGLLRKEETSTSIEFLTSIEVSREEIYISKFITSIIHTTLILFLTLLAVVICGLIVGSDTFIFSELLKVTLICSIIPYLYSGVAFMLAGNSPKLGSNIVITGVILITYIIGYLGGLLGKNAEFITYLSPFTILNYSNVLDLNTTTIFLLVIYIIIFIISIVLGINTYKRRDLIV